MFTQHFKDNFRFIIATAISLKNSLAQVFCICIGYRDKIKFIFLSWLQRNERDKCSTLSSYIITLILELHRTLDILIQQPYSHSSIPLQVLLQNSVTLQQMPILGVISWIANPDLFSGHALSLQKNQQKIFGNKVVSYQVYLS